MKASIWYACDEHVDIVIDDFVDTYEMPPLMDLCHPSPPHARCRWCGEKPAYQLAASEEKLE